MTPNLPRREFVRVFAVAGTAGALAGCTGQDGEDGGDGDTPTEAGTATPADAGTATGTPGGTPSAAARVEAGPNDELVFRPEQVTISVGDSVEWIFRSANHNVSAIPEDSEEVQIPEGAEPFASYEDDEFETVPEGETYEHTFETAGTYTYVCIPHVSAGMIAEVVVEE